MPNLFAHVMLLGWPIISLYFYKRFNVVTATFCTIIGGYLLLPVKVKYFIPLIPPLDKEVISVLSAILGCIFIQKIKLSLLPPQKLQRILVLIALLAPVFSIISNQNPVFDGANWIGGIPLYTSFTAVLDQFLRLFPLIIASQIIKSEEDFILFCKLFVISGICYSFAILIEVRLSPQLHTWVYGFFPHDFSQQIRFGGFRPVVFLGHGLLVAIYCMAAFSLSFLLWKRNIRVHPSISPLFVMLYLLFVLFLTKSVAAILFGLVIVVISLLQSRRLNKATVQSITFTVLFYPLLCILQLFPHENIVEYIQSISFEKAMSLNFRFYHEVLLLDHVRDQFLFGWGGWGRNRLDGSVTDGQWIIELGVSGIVGFIATFGLVCSCILSAVKKSSIYGNIGKKDTLLISSLTLALMMVDQILNASLYNWLWLFAGVLLGYSSLIKSNNQN